MNGDEGQDIYCGRSMMPDVDCGLCHASAIHISSALLSVSRKSWNLASQVAYIRMLLQLVFTSRWAVTFIRSTLTKEARLSLEMVITHDHDINCSTTIFHLNKSLTMIIFVAITVCLLIEKFAKY